MLHFYDTHFSVLPLAFYTTFGKRRHVKGQNAGGTADQGQPEAWVLELPKVLFIFFFTGRRGRRIIRAIQRPLCASDLLLLLSVMASQ